jgi:hypothetical protein
VLFHPYINAFEWHLTHDANVNCAGYRIVVPNNFIVSSTIQDLVTLEHTRNSLSTKLYKYSWITIVKDDPPADMKNINFINAVIRKSPQSEVSITNNVPIAGYPATCIQRNHQEKQDMQVNFTCVNADGLTILYSGDGDDVDEFKGILSRIAKQ